MAVVSSVAGTTIQSSTDSPGAVAGAHRESAGRTNMKAASDGS